MKLLVIGHGQHGKDEVAKIIGNVTGLTFCSSSWFVMEHAIWPMIGHEYDTKEECYADRRNRRDGWFSMIRKYNAGDDTRLARMLLRKYDMYIGLRSIQEFKASLHLFDHVIWVDRGEHKPLEPSMEIEFNNESMHYVDNNDALEVTRRYLERGLIPKLLNA